MRSERPYLVERYAGGLSAITELPTKSIDRHIEQLKKVGLIEFKGTAKTGGYHVIPKVRTETGQKS